MSEKMLLNQYVVMDDSFIHSIHLQRAPALCWALFQALGFSYNIINRQRIPSIRGALCVLWGKRQSTSKIHRPLYDGGDKSREKKGNGWEEGREEIESGVWKASVRRWHLSKG